MQVTIETFSKKDTEYKVELGNLKEIVKDKTFYSEFNNPDLSAISDHKLKLDRLTMINMENVAGRLEELNVENDGSITAHFNPSKLFESIYPETETFQPQFGMRAISRANYDEDGKLTYDVEKIISWDLIDMVPKTEIPQEGLKIEDIGNNSFAVKVNDEFVDIINNLTSEVYDEVLITYNTELTTKESSVSKVITSCKFDYRNKIANKCLPFIKETFKEILKKENEIILFMECKVNYEGEDVFVFYLNKET